MGKKEQDDNQQEQTVDNQLNTEMQIQFTLNGDKLVLKSTRTIVPSQLISWSSIPIPKDVKLFHNPKTEANVEFVMTQKGEFESKALKEINPKTSLVFRSGSMPLPHRKEEKIVNNTKVTLLNPLKLTEQQIKNSNLPFFNIDPTLKPNACVSPMVKNGRFCFCVKSICEMKQGEILVIRQNVEDTIEHN